MNFLTQCTSDGGKVSLPIANSCCSNEVILSSPTLNSSHKPLDSDDVTACGTST